MANYHFHVTQIKRSKGQSAVACAAYRSGEKLYSDYYGEVSDYTRKRGIVRTEILLPSHAHPNIPTARHYGTPLKKPNRTRKRSSHTVLTLPCKTSFL